MTLIEKVQAAVAKSLGDDLENHMLRSRRIKVSRAAIAAVFDWLADDPGQGAAEAGADALLEHGLDIFFDGRDAKACWTAMLAAKRKEALGGV